MVCNMFVWPIKLTNTIFYWEPMVRIIIYWSGGLNFYKTFNNSRAVVTPSWKEEAARELSNAISAIDKQLGELEKEGQQIIDDIRRQSSNPLDPRVQEQVAQVQNQVASKRSEFEEQKRNLLLQQSQVRELEMEQIVEQGQIDSFYDLKVGDNLVSKMGVSILVRDGVVEAIDQDWNLVELQLIQ